MVKLEYRIETHGVSPKEHGERFSDDTVYHEFEDLTDDWFNDIGKDGWELVDIKHNNMVLGKGWKKFYFFFKCPVE